MYADPYSPMRTSDTSPLLNPGNARTIDKMDHTATTPLPRQSGAPRARSPYATTYALIAINVLVFAAMVASGVSFTQPAAQDVLNWGGDYGPLTVGAHQWWRLLTSCFLHFGIIHIGFNMYVLYQIGPFIELAFRRVRYLLIYFFAGLGGSLVSVWVHPMAVGAGASGAIFGLYGAVFSFLLKNRQSLDPAVTKSIGQSAGIFILYNVVYGSLTRTTDLSAHIGGLVTGFVVGSLLIRPRPVSPAQPNLTSPTQPT
jgi:rhomboid protease GluP